MSIAGRFLRVGLDRAAGLGSPRNAALGLRFPCSEEDLKRAYRQRVKQLQPDHGGDQRRFLILQSQSEEAVAIIAGQPLFGCSH